MIHEGIYATLSGNAGVSAIVGTRIYPVVMPQTAYTESSKKPCIVYRFDSRLRQVRFSGTDTLVDGSLVIECYAVTRIEASELADAVRSALVDYNGTMTGTGSPVSSNRVQGIFLESENETFYPEPGVFIVTQDYRIWYDEA